MATDEHSFGYLLRRSRLAALLTQEQLAERAHLSYRTISDLERGAKHAPRRDTVLLLADALELPADERARLEAAARPPRARAAREDHDQAILPAAGAIGAFLLADIRGYTRFTEEQGDEAAARLTSTFAALAQEVTQACAGRLVETRGDEVLAVFSSARQALRAAVQLQERCARAAEADPTLPLHVGMGLDAGEPIVVGAGYRGGALNLAARLCALAGPGEIFASTGVVHVARRIAGLVFVDRGAVRLKGVTEPVPVIQIAPEGALPEDLPPLQPILVTHPTNLPDEPTPFIGREREIAAISELLQRPTVGLVTLTGAGGTGKTRLALQVGMALLDQLRDGVFFVSLASVADHELVPSTIAATLGVKETGSQSLLDLLAEHLRPKHFLLILDNFEHLLEAAGVVAALLDGCPQLEVLVTSRAILHLSREYDVEVPPLSLPDPKHLPDLPQLTQYEAVALFIERAQAARAGFAITHANAPAVAAICHRLDGLPLAIELAAARIRLLPPLALLQKLDQRLPLLTGGARDRPVRQHTVRNTIDWSYSLLTGPEQTLFARLSVFAGGCTLEAAEAVCQPEGKLEIETVEGVTSLLEQSLLREAGEEEPRFAMLGTIREYAAERLEAGEQAEAVRERHAAYYLGLAEEAEPELRGTEQVRWLNRLGTEHDNLRAALGWLLAEERAEEGLRLAGALWRFWQIHGHLSEGRWWLERALAVGARGSRAVRTKALNGAGVLALSQGDYQRATTQLDQSLALAGELGDTRGIAASLSNLGDVAFAHGDYERAATLFDESLALDRELGDTWGIAISLNLLGNVALAQGDYERATTLYEESLTLRRELGDTWGIANSLLVLGVVSEFQGDYERATTLYEQSLALARELGDTRTIAWTLNNLGMVAWAQGDYDRATILCGESLALARELGGDLLAVEPVDTLANVAAARYEPERAALLWGAADAWRESTGVPLPPVGRQQHERVVAGARQQLDEAAWIAAWEEGRALTLEQAIAYALGEATPQTPEARESTAPT